MSVALVLHAVLETLKVSLPTVWESVQGPLDPAVVDARLASWSAALLDKAQVKLQVVGAEHALADESYVVMSNHQSLYDVPVIYRALPGRRLRMVAKAELFRVPVWGAAMRAAGFIEIHREDRERARRTLLASSNVLGQGTSVWIAPEGTRSGSGALGEFRKGGFHLALQSGAHVLPISIRGTRDVLASGAARINRGAAVHVTVHSPIDPAVFGEARRDDLMHAVRSAIAAGLAA